MQMSFRGATAKSGSWISITSPSKRREYDDANGTPGITHISFGVNANPADFPRIAEEVHQRFPDLKKPHTAKIVAAHLKTAYYDQLVVIRVGLTRFAGGGG
jgi:hypothetical protein